MTKGFMAVLMPLVLASLAQAQSYHEGACDVQADQTVSLLQHSSLSGRGEGVVARAAQEEEEKEDEDVEQDCAWWFDATTHLCELDGLRRRSAASDTAHICKTGDGGPTGKERKGCTGHFGAVSEGEIANAAYAESFDVDGVVGAWTTEGEGSTSEKSADGGWQCIEDKKYNWVDYNDCNAVPFDRTHRTGGVAPANLEKHPDDVDPLMACWSCGWVMWYKKEHCKCCDPNQLIGEKLNGEECCDGIDMACGINGHDRRDGTPRGKEVCDDLAGDESEKQSEVCEALRQDPKPSYGSASRVRDGPLNGKTPYVHTSEDYKRWLKWDPALCYQHGEKQECALFEGCKWKDETGCTKSGEGGDWADVDVGDDDTGEGFGFEGEAGDTDIDVDS